MRIGVVAPSTPIERSVAEQVTALAATTHPEAELLFHPQCFLTHRHFAGDDRTRLEALVEVANDPEIDGVWFARGGYGSCRIAEAAIARFDEGARDKTYLGYSDAGFLLAGLYKAGFQNLAHGPMPQDVKRDGGDAAIVRALDWLVHASAASLEPSISGEAPPAAFNITVLSQLLGTALEPELGGHVLMLEEVSEHTYRTDRAMFHITGNLAGAGIAGIRLGRCSLVPENDPDFGGNEEEVVRYWCERSGIPWLGLADIGHDAANKVVPFGNVGQRSAKRA
jgi:muramoyltetrapeptide carboxypeptidase